MSTRKAALAVLISGDTEKLERALIKGGGGLDKFGKKAEHNNMKVGTSFAGMAKRAAGAGVAVVGAYASIAGAKKAIDTTTTLAKTTLTLHKSFGLTVKSGSEWAAISQARGADGKQMTMGFKALATATRNAREGIKGQSGAVDDLRAKQSAAVDQAIADGKSTADITRLKKDQAAALDTLMGKTTAQAKVFDELGISQQELAKHGDDMEWVIRRVSDGLAKLPTGTDKAAIAAKLFGRTWTTIAPLVRGGSKALDEQLKLADKYGVTLKGKTVKSVEELIAAQRENKLATMGLQVALGEELIPVLTKGVQAGSHFIAQMRDGTGAGGQFADTAKEIGTEVKPVASFLLKAGAAVGKFTEHHPEVGKLAFAIVGVGLAVKALKFAGAVTGLTEVVKIVKAGRAAMLLFNASLLANPIVLVTAGIVSFGAAMVIAYKKSETFRKIVNGALNVVADAVDAVVGGVSSMLSALGHVPGFGWAKRGAEAIDKAREATRGFVDNLNKIPAKKTIVLDIKPSNRTSAAGLTASDFVLPSFHTKSAGGVIPGVGDRDTVPLMGTPGEFVIRKKIVEKYGPTFFAAINAGQEPQLRADGGVIGPSTVSKMQSAARGWVGLPYIYGAGHGGFGPSGGGFDCSGFVSAVLGVGGAISAPMAVRQPLQSALLPGPGKYVTVGIRGTSGRNAHTMIKVGSRYFEAASHGVVESGGWRGAFDLFHPRNEATRGGATEKDPGQADGAGGGSAPSRSEKQARAGSRVVNALAREDLKGVAAVAGRATSLGSAIDAADTTYSQVERFFGQVIGGKFVDGKRVGDTFGDEKLDTKEGREARTGELNELRRLKAAQKRRMQQGKTKLKAVVKHYDNLIKHIRAERKKAHGAKRAKINERLKSYEDRRAEFAAEANALGAAIQDVDLDIGDLDNELQQVASTPDAVVDDGSAVAAEPFDLAGTQADLISGNLSTTDLMERAGVITPEQARTQKLSSIDQWLAGALGPLTQTQTWELMADRNDLLKQNTDATSDVAQALADLKQSIDQSNAIASSELAIGLREARRVVADMVNGELGAKVGPRSLMPGSGELSRL